VFFAESLVARTAGAFVLAFKWLLVLVAVLVLLVVVPIIELLSELSRLARRVFARLR
jgi:glycerol-3-phosphate acyltransferase PlsY